MTKEEEKLLDKIFREHIATLQAEKYRAESEIKMYKSDYYDKEIEKVRNLKNKLLARG